MALIDKYFNLSSKHLSKVLENNDDAANCPQVIQYVAVHQEAGTTVAVSGTLTATLSAGSEIIATGLITNPSATVTRPADTTAYATGDLVANSTTAGSVTPGTLTIARAAGGTAMLRRCGIRKTGTNVTNASFRVHLYRAAPTVTNGDNGAFLSTGSADYLGAFDVTVDQAFSDGAVGFGVPTTASDISVDLASGTDVRFLIEARGAYTPTSAEAFTVILDNFPN